MQKKLLMELKETEKSTFVRNWDRIYGSRCEWNGQRLGRSLARTLRIVSESKELNGTRNKLMTATSKEKDGSQFVNALFHTKNKWETRILNGN